MLLCVSVYTYQPNMYYINNNNNLIFVCKISAYIYFKNFIYIIYDDNIICPICFIEEDKKKILYLYPPLRYFKY